MFENMSEQDARMQILNLIKEYYKEYHKATEYKISNKIPYASRVYDEKELVNLVDSSLEFWLTSGRYTNEFEKNLQIT